MKNMIEDIVLCRLCGETIPEGRSLCAACYGAAAEARPTMDEVFEAAKVIKRYCMSRAEDPGTDCVKCPIKDICLNEPYLWEV